jgi:hypothetical protein
VIQRLRLNLSTVLFLLAIFTWNALAAGQATKNAVPDKPSNAQPADVAGNWQVSWTNRLGTEQCTLHLQQDGTKLTGTLQGPHGLSSLSGTMSGTIDPKRIVFDVQFEGPRPYTIRFTGTADGGKIEGTSQAVGLGGAGAFLGHGGEIVQPDHPWTAKRVANQSTQSSQTGSTQDSPAKN